MVASRRCPVVLCAAEYGQRHVCQWISNSTMRYTCFQGECHWWRCHAWWPSVECWQMLSGWRRCVAVDALQFCRSLAVHYRQPATGTGSIAYIAYMYICDVLMMMDQFGGWAVITSQQHCSSNSHLYTSDIIIILYIIDISTSRQRIAEREYIDKGQPIDIKLNERNIAW